MGPGSEIGGAAKPTVAVADASSLIGLHQLGLLHVLPVIYGRINVPPAVQSETVSVGPLPEWIDVIEVANDSGRVNLFDNLQPGETDAIQLALQTGAQWLITDDLAARKAADSRGIGIVGVLGVLILSKRAGLIPEVKPFVLRLLDLGFRLGYTVCGEALRMAGEDPSDLLEEIHDEP